MDRIPFNKPSLVGNEIPYILDAVQKGHLSGNGEFSRRCEELIGAELGGARVFLAPSCTHALEMSSLLLDIGPGDEVILPAFTFVSTANAYAIRGARPVFADIEPGTLNIDPDHVKRLVTEKTRAIVPVHYGGVGCDMDALAAIARDRGIAIIEDNAHGLFGALDGKPLGTFGALATLSFHETKNFTCGEGGALVVNDPELVERAEIVREKGTDRSRFFRGEVDKYTWVDLGSSFLPSEVQAAFLLAQLEKRDEVLRRRAEIWDTYARELAPWAADRGVTLPHVPERCVQGYHVFYLLLPDLETRTRLIAHLGARDILAVFHYLPLHVSPMGTRFGGRPGDCPVTEDVSERLLRLPLYYGLTHDEQMRVIEAVQGFNTSR